MNKKTLNKVLGGLADKNVRFQDLKKLLGDLGLYVRIKGDALVKSRKSLMVVIPAKTRVQAILK